MLIKPTEYNFDKVKGFIVLEGANGAGKTTLLKNLSARLSEQSIEVVETREPGGTPFGKQVRDIVLGHADKGIEPRSEVFLFAADRAHHVSSLIKPALEQKKIVLCDRYIYSTLAFQGYGRGLPIDTLTEINLYAVQNLVPDLVIVLDIDPEEGLRRTQSREAGTEVKVDDGFERESLEFQHALRNGFLKLADERPEPFLVLDASQDPADIAEQAFLALSSFLKSWRTA